MAGTAYHLLRLLVQSGGKTLSGQDVAHSLGVSRAAVWKAAERLRETGVPLNAVPGGGYSLAAGADYLTQDSLAVYLDGQVALRFFDEVDSTSLAAKRWALEGAPHGALVAAARQTGGRGRQGRSFASPPGGVYMSCVLRPQLPATQAVLVTAAAAVAVRRAVQQLCGLPLEVKWVNDLFYRGKKCCGILSEAGTNFEDGGLEYIVVGIGLNYTTPQAALGAPLADVATSLYPAGRAPAPRAALIPAIHAQLLALFDALPATGFLEEYRAASLVLGREVEVLAQPPYTAHAYGIDENARLLVRMPGGEERALSSGEISIRL